MTRLTIGRKLSLGLGALVLSLLLLSYSWLAAISTLGDFLNAAVHGTAKKLELIQTAREAFDALKDESSREQVAYTILQMEHQAGANSSQSAMACSSCHSPRTVDDSMRATEAAVGTVRAQTWQLRRLITDDTGKTALATLDAGAANWLIYSKQYLALSSQKQFDGAHAILRDKMLPIVDDIDKAGKLLSRREWEASAVLNN